MKGDPTRIQQILLNLVGNSIKFTPQGEIWIEVRRTSPETVSFSVEDSGTRQHGGSGLGLAICRDLVQLMGGKLGYEPRAEGGSRFWFTPSIAPLLAREISPLGKRVRFASSDSCGRRLIERVLPDWGCTAANTGEEFDLLIAPDQLTLPIRQSQLRARLSGFPLPAQILRNETQPNLGLKILVAEVNAVNRRLILSFLKKPGCEAQLAENGQLAVEAALRDDSRNTRCLFSMA